MRSEQEIREMIKWLDERKDNKQIAHSMKIALMWTVGDLGFMSFPGQNLFKDELDQIKKALASIERKSE